MLFEPLEARPELCASAADWVERNTLPCFEGLKLMDSRVEVENANVGSSKLTSSHLSPINSLRRRPVTVSRSVMDILLPDRLT